ncbi:hypothetical protein [Campylobacter concisus]|uniref:hypothetical protein n=1 Tax=Campylobacter concisus TaxID=199 RepID=UPI000CD8717D|nr:hypothetical protein [Campylobacter concisus]
MKVKLKSTVDISSLELRELSAFDRLEKDTIYDILSMEMYEDKVKFIYKIQRLINILEKRSFNMLTDVKLEFA